jgi:alkaline phosphatase D
MHRRLGVGSLATLHVLDTRQYRSGQIAGDAWQRSKPERVDPRRTMLGRPQQRWFAAGMAESTTTWNVVAQQAPAGSADAETVGVELATTSITSGGDGNDLSPTGQRFLDANPHLHYASQRRGYLRCRFTPTHVTVDFRTVPYVTGRADAPITTDRSFVVEAGQRQLHVA